MSQSFYLANTNRESEESLPPLPNYHTNPGYYTSNVHLEHSPYGQVYQQQLQVSHQQSITHHDSSASYQTLSYNNFLGDEYAYDQISCYREDRSKKEQENPRNARNKAEQLRRDKLNCTVSDLKTIVPLIANSSRKQDKTSVMRLTGHTLREEHVFGRSMRHCHLELSEDTVNAVTGCLNGFLFCATYRGVIVALSKNFETYLGHNRVDLYGQNLSKLVHKDDVENLKKYLLPNGCTAAANGQIIWPENCNKKTLMNTRRYFYLRFEKAVQRPECPCYDLFIVDGTFRPADNAVPGMHNGSQCHSLRRHRIRNDETICPSGNDLVFIGMARPMPNSIMRHSSLDDTSVYQTRHLVDGRIIQCGHRISLIAGYMVNEVTGVSAFQFMHKDDVRWAMIALRQMYDRSQKYGESCYRLITRTGNFIYLRTRGFLEVDPATKATGSFVCINTLVSNEDGKRYSDEMKLKYRAMINDQNDTHETEEVTAEVSDNMGVEDPKQIEQAIMHLVTNLPIATSSESTSSASPTISIIPPEPEEIKEAIIKGVTVISKAVKSKFLDDYKESSRASKPADRPTVVQMCPQSRPVDQTAKVNDHPMKNGDNHVSTPNVTKLTKAEILPDPSIFTTSDSSDNFIFTDGSHDNATIIYNEQSGNDKIAEKFIFGENLFTGKTEELPSTSATNQPLPHLKRIFDSEFNEAVITKRINQGASEDEYEEIYLNPLPIHLENNVEDDDSLESSENFLSALDNVPEEGFNEYMEELSVPDSDIPTIIPQSLAALESTLNGIDDAASKLTSQQRHLQEELLSCQNDIIAKNEDHKN